jgi:predicted alpha/beta-hydrolase family hydrolase
MAAESTGLEALRDGPEGGRPFLLAHGAGGRNTSPWLGEVAAGLAAGALRVARFNFPYATAGRRAPDRPPVLLAAWRQAVTEFGDGRPDTVLAGKSMGGRYATMVMAEPDPPPASAVVLYGYPLHAPGRVDRLRREHLPAVAVPMLFLSGSRDPFARLDLIEETVAALGAAATLHVIDGADHDFRVKGRPHKDVLRELVDVTLAAIRPAPPA